jgi:CO/xanthine dehydrogenase Mo-binding subunit
MPTWTACVARVKVDRSTGVINVERLTHVLDCGTRIDPDGALAQAEGGTLWGVSLALHESSSFVRGRVSTLNLNSYTPLRLNNVPELDIEFIDNAEFPSGMGEPPVIAVAPAIGNAVFAAVGVRLRDLPMRPEQVLRELKKMRR